MLPLEFVVDPKNTRMYSDLGPQAYEFTTHNFTYNSHTYGFHPETFESDPGLKEFWTVTSHSIAPDGTPFVASIEAKNYPIYGTQYHPEKPSELWVDGDNINHTWESIQLNDHFSKLLVEMSRANPNTFGNFTQTQVYEISNYPVL